jgi:hypothetical protein
VALRVDLPTPPLPATTTTELWVKKAFIAVMSTHTHMPLGYIPPLNPMASSDELWNRRSA